MERVDMSNKFGEFWYIPTIDNDGFDIHNAKGIVDYETTSEKAIANCQRRYIAALESDNSRLMDRLNVIREVAEPLRYAVREGVQRGTESDAPICAGIGYMYASDDDTLLRLPDLKKLINAIMDDAPDIVIPNYS
jgi:hypothetical protein